jgi:site-specific recombinase XerD
MEMPVMPFVWQSQSRSNANSSISQVLTLNVFFDDHYIPHITVAKKETKHDWSIYNKHMRAQLGRYMLQDITNPVMDVWVREQIVAGYKRSTINKHIFLLNRFLNIARRWGFIPHQSHNQHNIKKLPVGDFKQRFLDKHEIEHLLKHCRTSTPNSHKIHICWEYELSR